MGYQIRYPSVGISGCKHKSSKRFLSLTVLFFALFFTLTLLHWPEGRSVLINIAIPGNPENAAAALDNLIESFSLGESPTEAVKTFCDSILKGAAFAAY